MIRVLPILLVTFCFYNSASAEKFERLFPLPVGKNDLVGENRSVTTSAEDTLIDVAARNGLGYNLVRTANPTVDAWLPGDDTPVLLPIQVILPTANRRGIVINVAEMRLFHYIDSPSASVEVYPISVGRGEWATPITKSRITGRAQNPIWYPPASIRKEHAARGDILPAQVPPGPENPLGEFLLTLDIPSYFIHGTNRRLGIGMQVTHGCIRMYPEDIEQLVKQVANGTEVTIINQTVKTGWHERQLYLEVHPPLESENSETINLREVSINTLDRATKNHPEVIIDWKAFENIVASASGIPEKIGYLPPAVTTLLE